MDIKAKKILIIGNSPITSRILLHSIQSILKLEVECAKTMAETKDILDNQSSNPFFIAVVDIDLPDAPNGEVVDVVLDAGIAPIILTDVMSDDVHDELMEKPIIDYVVKHNLVEINYVIQTIARLQANMTRKVLVVDDSKSSRVLLSSLLKRHFLQVYTAGDGQEGLTVLAEHSDITLIITDYNMPNMDGLEFTKKVRDLYAASEIAIIGISTVGAGSISVKFLKYGANDFITRPFLHEEFYCRINQNIDSIANFKTLKDSSNQDLLTGLCNRNYLFLLGKKLIQNAVRKNISLTIAIFSIDNFKDINNKNNHDVGDSVIKQVAEVLSSQLRESDILARIGNKEFCLLSINLDDKDAENLYARYQSAVSENPFKADFISIATSISIGYSGELKDNLDDLLCDADNALSRAKKSGPSSIIKFS